MKLLCDQMLVRLGRWLRAAGYDTEIIEHSVPDRKILEQALKEERYLITRDRHFLGFKEASNLIIWLQANATEDCVQELSKKLPIDWTKEPFSRCMLCNQKLIEAENDLLNSVPDGVRVHCDKYWTCKKCGRIYWMGSHTEKILKKLKQWKTLTG